MFRTRRPISSSFLRMLCTHRMTINVEPRTEPNTGSRGQEAPGGHEVRCGPRHVHYCLRLLLSLSIIPEFRRTGVVMWHGTAFWLHGWRCFVFLQRFLCHSIKSNFSSASSIHQVRMRRSPSTDKLRRGLRPSRRGFCCIHSVPMVTAALTGMFCAEITELRGVGIAGTETESICGGIW